jgi:hypothetical protein
MNEYLTLGDAAALVGKLTGRKRPSIPTMFRWTRYGIHGKRLAYAKAGRLTLIKPADIETFFREVADADPIVKPGQIRPRRPKPVSPPPVSQGTPLSPEQRAQVDRLCARHGLVDNAGRG